MTDRDINLQDPQQQQFTEQEMIQLSQQQIQPSYQSIENKTQVQIAEDYIKNASNLVDLTKKHPILEEINKKSMVLNYTPLEIMLKAQKKLSVNFLNNNPSELFQLKPEEFQEFCFQLKISNCDKYSIDIDSINNSEDSPELQEIIDFRDAPEQFYDKNQGTFSALKIAIAIASHNIKYNKYSYIEILKYSILQIIEKDSRFNKQVLDFFYHFARGDIKEYLYKDKRDLNFQSEKYWNIASFHTIVKHYNIPIPQSFLIITWQRIANTEGVMTLQEVKEYLKTRKRPFRFQFCHSKEDEFEVINDENNQSECFNKLVRRTDMMFYVPNYILQEQSFHFAYQKNSLLNQIIGPGYPLFFEFFYYCIIILCSLFLSSGAYNILSNFGMGNDCEESADDSQCQLNWITIFSLENKRYDYELNQLQNSMTIFSIIMLPIIFQFKRKAQRQIVFSIDKDSKSRQDYTILVKNIILKNPSEDSMFQNYLQKNNINPISEQDQQNHQINFVKKKIRKYIFKNYFKMYQVDDITNQTLPEDILMIQVNPEKREYWAFITLEYEQQRNIFLHEEFLIKEVFNSLTNQEVILFKNQSEDPHAPDFRQIFYYTTEEKNFLFDQHQKMLEDLEDETPHKYSVFKDAIFTESYEPEEYNWDNITQQNKSHKFLSFLLMLLALFISTMIIYGANYVQQYFQLQHEKQLKQLDQLGQQLLKNNDSHSQNTENNIYINHHHFAQQQSNDTQQQFDELSSEVHGWVFMFIVSQIVAWTISGINYGLEQLVLYANSLEKNSFKTVDKSSIAHKLYWINVFNQTIILFLINVVYVWSQDGLAEARKSIYRKGGLVYNINMLFINNAIKDPVMELVPVFQDIIKRYVFSRFNLSGGLDTLTFLLKGKQNTLDSEAFEALEDTYIEAAQPYGIEERYAWVMGTMFLTVFYAPLIPTGFIWSIIGITVMYKIQKFRLLYTSRINHPLDKQLSREMTESLENLLIVYCFSNLIFEYIVVHGTLVQPDGEKLEFGAEDNSRRIIVLLYQMLVRSDKFLLLGALFGLIHSILPMQDFNEMLFPVAALDTDAKDKISYKEAQPLMCAQNTYFESYYTTVPYKKSVYAFEKVENEEELSEKQKNYQEFREYIQKIQTLKWPKTEQYYDRKNIDKKSQKSKEYSSPYSDTEIGIAHNLIDYKQTPVQSANVLSSKPNQKNKPFMGSLLPQDVVKGQKKQILLKEKLFNKTFSFDSILFKAYNLFLSRIFPLAGSINYDRDTIPLKNINYEALKEEAIKVEDEEYVQAQLYEKPL